MDVLENILERISQTQEQRDVYLRQAEAEERRSPSWSRCTTCSKIPPRRS